LTVPDYDSIDLTTRQFCCSYIAGRRGPLAKHSGGPRQVQRDLTVKYCIVYSTKHRHSAGAHARKVLPFSVKNELGLENYLGYQCTKFGENQ